MRRLVDAGASVRALARSAGSEAKLAELGAQPVPGDLAEPERLDAAMDGAERVFLLTPPHPADVAWTANAVDAAARAGVRHLVRSSVLGAQPSAPARMARQHGENDRYALRSGVPHTILRPNYFMQNVTEVVAPSADAEGNVYASAGRARLSMVDTSDVAEVAAAVLTGGGSHLGQVYELTGPEALSYADVTAKLSASTGRTLTSIDVPDEATRQALLGFGIDTWTVDAVVELFQSYRAAGPDGWAATVTGSVEALTGRPPPPPHTRRAAPGRPAGPGGLTTMRPDIAPGAHLPDFALSDHTRTRRRLSELQGSDPMILVLSRGGFCPKDHQQHRELVDFHPRIAVAYTTIVTVSTDNLLKTIEFRDAVGAQWTFLADPGRKVQKALDIQDYTDPWNDPMVPYTMVLAPGLLIHSVYNGHWFWGRPSPEDLRRDLRELTRTLRPDWDLDAAGLREAWAAGDRSRHWPYSAGGPTDVYPELEESGGGAGAPSPEVA